jgi:hypothetical protein
VSASTISRPTENAAIGRVGRPPVLDLKQLLLDHGAARTRRDLHGVHIIQGRISRAVNPKGGE